MVPHVSDVDAISYSRQIGLNTENASPPTNAYIGRDDRLQIFAATSVAGGFFTVFARVLLADGTIVPNQWQVSPLNARNGQNFYLDLSEGFLLSMTVSGGNASGPGMTFVRVSLIRGTVVLNALSQTLVEGYVTGFCSLCWPWSPLTPSTNGRGNIRSITGTTPGAGQQINESVPLNALWRLISFGFGFSASAAAGTRIVMLTIYDGANNVLFISGPSGLNLTSGNGINFYFADGITTASALNGVANVCLPRELYLRPGWSIRSSVSNIDAGDVWNPVYYLVEEWIIG